MFRLIDLKLAKKFYEETKSCGATAIRFHISPTELREYIKEIPTPKYKYKWDTRKGFKFLENFDTHNFRYKDLDKFTHLNDEEKKDIIKMWEELDI